MCTPWKKQSSGVLNSSTKTVANPGSGVHQVSRSTRDLMSFKGSLTPTSYMFCNGSRKLNSLHTGASQAPGRAVVFDTQGKECTPLPLYHTESGALQSKPDRLFLDEILSNSGSDKSNSISGVSLAFSSSPLCSLSSKTSLSKKTEDSVSKLDSPVFHPVPDEIPMKANNMKQQVADEMLDEMVEICLSETDTISLLDIPTTSVSEDANDADAIKERNSHYAELCKSRKGNDKYVERLMQTFSGAKKEKQIQTDTIIMADEDSVATVSDIYDSLCDQNKTSETEKEDYSQRTVNPRRGQEMSGESCSRSSNSTVSTGSATTSLIEMEMCGNGFNTGTEPQMVLLSESFQRSLSVMERSIVVHISQPQLAAYRQLHIPAVHEPDSTEKPGTEEQSDESEESSASPTLDHLWAFSCEVTSHQQCSVTSMAWNKKDPDILAVGYGDWDSGNQKPGLICCWSLKNLTWPVWFVHCHSSVTSLDFSATNPGQLAVGMFDGTIAIYNVQIRNSTACIASSSDCSNKHLHQVWQVNWIQQEMALSGEDKAEALISVGADGRITKWVHCSHLDAIDLMKLRRFQSYKKAAEGKEKAESVLSTLTPGLCIAFHPSDSTIYLIGTWEGLIHKCSVSNNQYFLQTYQKHFCPVNFIEWSPFYSDVFLSCSSDWTVQLWKQDSLTPVLSFTSSQKDVYAVRWSPNWSTVFAAITEEQLEIWDLNSSIRAPTIVHRAAPGVKMTSLLFSRGTDCVLVGDSDGHVTVYLLKNLIVGEVGSLKGIIDSCVSL